MMTRIGMMAVLIGGLSAGEALAQCQGGGGGSQRGGGGGAAGVASGGGELLTSPGSWFYDVMVAQQVQQRVAQQRYQLAVQQAEQKQQELAQRKAWSEQKRQEIADRRLRMRTFLAQQSGTVPPTMAAVYSAALTTSR
ncbi:MAG: hypothetical protein SFU86_22455 [Pirellulaceae bacterium]|nr:hypothetical protein [Pirellulaceae bacterium]